MLKTSKLDKKGSGCMSPNKKQIRNNIFILLSAVVLCFMMLIGYGIYWAFFDMKRLPQGEFLTEEESPNGQYTIKLYLTNGGATTPYAIRGELVFHERAGKTKNIYWNLGETAEVQWLDDQTVEINGISLNVLKDRFDFRRE